MSTNGANRSQPTHHFEGFDLAERAPLHRMLTKLANPDVAVAFSETEPRLHLTDDGGTSVDEVLTEVEAEVMSRLVYFRHPFAIAHMVPPPATIAVIADLLIGAMNQCAFVWEQCPAGIVLEREVVQWMLRHIGFGADSTGLLTSGGTMSNLLAVYLALATAEADVRACPERFCIISSDQAHLSIDKAVRLLGLPVSILVKVPTQSNGRLPKGQIQLAVERAIQAGKHPFMLICTCGTTNTGTLEDCGEFLSIARNVGGWCHIDAAYGGFMSLFKDSHKHLSHWPEADSLSWDPHKTLYTSYGVGALLVKRPGALAHLNFHAEYALKGSDFADPGQCHFEGSRRFEALKTWMTIRQLGTDGFREVLGHTIELAREFAQSIQRSDSFVLINEPDTNIVCFRFIHKARTEQELDVLNTAIQQTLYKENGPLVSTTTVAGRVVLRAVFLNPLLQVKDIPLLVRKIMFTGHRQAYMRTDIQVESSDEVCA
jgi:L-2,4-diaminobutyrate decarboxylase